MGNIVRHKTIFNAADSANSIASSAANATNAATDALSAAASAASIANLVQEVSISITSANVLSLNTTPIELVASPGAGKYLEVVSATVYIEYNSSAYDTNIKLLIRSSDADVAQFEDSSALISTITKSCKFIPNTIAATSAQTFLTENKGLEVLVDSGDPDNGDSDIKIKLLYRVVTI